MNTKLLIVFSTLLTSIIPSPSQAKVWRDYNGVLVSDTCFTKSGVNFVYSNFVGPVGSPCSFRLYNDPTLYSGVFG